MEFDIKVKDLREFLREQNIYLDKSYNNIKVKPYENLFKYAKPCNYEEYWDYEIFGPDPVIVKCYKLLLDVKKESSWSNDINSIYFNSNYLVFESSNGYAVSQHYTNEWIEFLAKKYGPSYVSFLSNHKDENINTLFNKIKKENQKIIDEKQKELCQGGFKVTKEDLQNFLHLYNKDININKNYLWEDVVFYMASPKHNPYKYQINDNYELKFNNREFVLYKSGVEKIDLSKVWVEYLSKQYKDKYEKYLEDWYQYKKTEIDNYYNTKMEELKKEHNKSLKKLENKKEKIYKSKQDDLEM